MKRENTSNKVTLVDAFVYKRAGDTNEPNLRNTLFFKKQARENKKKELMKWEKVRFD